MTKVKIIWNGESEKDLQRQAKLLEDMLNDPDLKITKEEFTEAWYKQIFSEQ